jgi:hypothetical protein
MSQKGKTDPIGAKVLKFQDSVLFWESKMAVADGSTNVLKRQRLQVKTSYFSDAARTPVMRRLFLFRDPPDDPKRQDWASAQGS